MKARTVYVFCDEKELRQDAFQLHEALKAKELGVKFVFLFRRSDLVYYLGRRIRRIDLLVMYKKMLNEAVELFVKELKDKVKCVALVHFQNSGNYLEEINIHVRRIKMKKKQVIFTLSETAQEVLGNYLLKTKEG